MIRIRNPEDIYQTSGAIQNGTFSGRWHFSFGDYRDPENTHFGTLRVFNDDTLSPGATWPLHPHREIEVVTYCAAGEFRHADEHGMGGILKKGWAQHTTVGKGISHSEINNRRDIPMRFIQMWFFPSEPGHDPSIEQKKVDQSERTNQFLPLISNDHAESLPIHSYAEIYSCLLQKGQNISYQIANTHGIYLYLIEGGPIFLEGQFMPQFGAAKITDESDIHIKAKDDAELLLVDVLLI